MVAKIMRNQLGKRNTDALTWRLGACGGAHIGSLLPVGVPREAPVPYQGLPRRKEPQEGTHRDSPPM